MDLHAPAPTSINNKSENCTALRMYRSVYSEMNGSRTNARPSGGLPEKLNYPTTIIVALTRQSA